MAAVLVTLLIGYSWLPMIQNSSIKEKKKKKKESKIFTAFFFWDTSHEDSKFKMVV